MQIFSFINSAERRTDLLQRLQTGPQDAANAAEFSPPAGIVADNDSSQIYATISRQGQVLATIYNSGAVESSNQLGSQINALVKNDAGSGPVLAQSRADRIAQLLGGKIDKAETAQSQTAWQNWSTDRNQKLADYYNTTSTHLAAQEIGAKSSTQDDNTTSADAQNDNCLLKSDNDAAGAFRAFMKKSPAERMIDQIMQAMGISKDDFAAMSPEKQQALMEKIHQIIEEKIRQGADSAQTATS